MDWDRDRGKVLIEKGWLDRFLTLVPPGGRVLDIGFGSGDPMATYLVRQGARVVGVDSSSEMVAMCERRFPGHQWIPSGT